MRKYFEVGKEQIQNIGRYFEIAKEYARSLARGAVLTAATFGFLGEGCMQPEPTRTLGEGYATPQKQEEWPAPDFDRLLKGNECVFSSPKAERIFLDAKEYATYLETRLLGYDPEYQLVHEKAEADVNRDGVVTENEAHQFGVWLLRRAFEYRIKCMQEHMQMEDSEE